MDCLAGMKLIPDESVDLIFADPPYNIGKKSKQIHADDRHFSSINEDWDTIDDYETFTDKLVAEYYRVLRKGGSLLTWGTRHNIYVTGYYVERHGFSIRTNYIWYKTNAMPCLTGRNPSESTEQLIWATKGSGWTYNLDFAKSINDGKNIRDVFISTMTPPSERTSGKHPSQKRISGLTDVLVSLHSKPDDIVLIPFCGSGSECVAVAQAKRHFISYETNPEYIELANKRLDAF